MTRQTWEEELDSRRLARIERLVEELVRHLPPPPQYKPTTAIVVTPVAPSKFSSPHS